MPAFFSRWARRRWMFGSSRRRSQPAVAGSWDVNAGTYRIPSQPNLAPASGARCVAMAERCVCAGAGLLLKNVGPPDERT